MAGMWSGKVSLRKWHLRKSDDGVKLSRQTRDGTRMWRRGQGPERDERNRFVMLREQAAGKASADKALSTLVSW